MIALLQNAGPRRAPDNLTSTGCRSHSVPMLPRLATDQRQKDECTLRQVLELRLR
jgi:hypothetical protein